MLDVLRFLPANAGKLFPNLSPREAADLARLRGDIKVISAANANSLMSNMSSFLNWAVNEELLARNPARGLRLPDPINKGDKHSPFDRDQLHAIFNAPLYCRCVDGARGYNKVGIGVHATRASECPSSHCSPTRDWVKSASLMPPTSGPSIVSL